MRLLVLSWRYLDNPAAGGAEVVVHEVLRRLAAQGHQVECFTAGHPGAPTTDEIDGVRIWRRGRQWTVHLHAWRWLRKRLDDYDCVVDQVNTIPFFTPLYVPRERRRLLIFQLAREYWWRETRGPFRLVAPIGYLAEPAFMRVYRMTMALTLSDSTRRDLMRLGLPYDCVAVLPAALTSEPLDQLQPKATPFSVIMVSRLTPAKFIEEGIAAFALLKREIPSAVLDIVGTGDSAYRKRLEEQVSSGKIGDVTFHGRVSTERKLELLAGAHAHLFTSHREGWGLVVTEAASMGTPSVGFDAPGVRDSIADPRLLAPVGDVSAVSQRMIALHRDPELYRELREAAWRSTLGLSYDSTTNAFLAALPFKGKS